MGNTGVVLSDPKAARSLSSSSSASLFKWDLGRGKHACGLSSLPMMHFSDKLTSHRIWLECKLGEMSMRSGKEVLRFGQVRSLRKVHLLPREAQHPS